MRRRPCAESLFPDLKQMNCRLFRADPPRTLPQSRPLCWRRNIVAHRGASRVSLGSAGRAACSLKGNVPTEDTNATAFKDFAFHGRVFSKLFPPANETVRASAAPAWERMCCRCLMYNLTGAQSGLLTWTSPVRPAVVSPPPCGQ